MGSIVGRQALMSVSGAGIVTEVVRWRVRRRFAWYVSVVTADVSAETYFQEIEAHFALRRGTPFILNAKDWALMKKWHDDGVPLPIVIEAIDTRLRKERGQRTQESDLQPQLLPPLDQGVVAGAAEPLRRRRRRHVRSPAPKRCSTRWRRSWKHRRSPRRSRRACARWRRRRASRRSRSD